MGSPERGDGHFKETVYEYTQGVKPSLSCSQGSATCEVTEWTICRIGVVGHCHTHQICSADNHGYGALYGLSYSFGNMHISVLRMQGRTGPPGCLALATDGPVGPPATWAAMANVKERNRTEEEVLV